MSIKDELIALQQRDGILRAEEVVRWAEGNPQSALHQSLEWNDTEAAKEYRIWQVRRLISIHIVSERGVRQMVSLTIDRANSGGGYRDIETVLASPEMREVLLADALAELERVRIKYEGLQELARVWDAVHAVKKRSRRSGAAVVERRNAMTG